MPYNLKLLALTAEDPYQISYDYHLMLLSELVSNEDIETSGKYAKAYYIQTTDIDLNTENFMPIGVWGQLSSPFRGNYNGNYHKIDNLNVDISEKGYAGLFGIVMGGTVTNLSVNGNVSATISNDDWILCGGITGGVSEGSLIKNCSFTGNVKGDKRGVGGIAGQLFRGGEISHCYFNGNVQTEAENCGGIVGHISDHSVVCTNKVTDCYAVGTVNGNGALGGIAGSSTRNQSETVYTIENNYYLNSMAESGINGYITTGCSGLSETLLKSGAELLGNPFVNNNEENGFNDGYPIFEWQSTPYQFKGSGTAEDPYQISSREELETMRDLVNSNYFHKQYDSCYYVQTADIDLENELWEPIGTRMKNGVNLSKPLFRGNYDGQCHTIKNLYVNKTGNDGYAGLFGSFRGNLAIENLVVYGSVSCDANHGCVGGICGEIVNGGGTVRNCAFIGDVYGKETIGGIAGTVYQNGSIENCYHIGKVVSTLEKEGKQVGGISGHIVVGDHVSGIANIKNCYHIGELIGAPDQTGGIVGYSDFITKVEGEAHVSNCYFMKDDITVGTNGKFNTCETIGLTSNLIKKIAEDLGEPFVTNTAPELNDGYPVFYWQTSSVKGDVNLDGKVSVSDAVMLQDWILCSGELICWENADLYKDNIINVFDLIELKKMLIKNCN